MRFNIMGDDARFDNRILVDLTSFSVTRDDSNFPILYLTLYLSTLWASAICTTTQTFQSYTCRLYELQHYAWRPYTLSTLYLSTLSFSTVNSSEFIVIGQKNLICQSNICQQLNFWNICESALNLSTLCFTILCVSTLSVSTLY